MSCAPNDVPVEDHLVAVVGLGCRYPGASGIEEFWQLTKPAC